MLSAPNNAVASTADTSHQVTGSSFTAEQLEQRRHTLGGSEVPAVLGLDRYRGPHDVWLQKRGLAPAFGGNEYTEWGLRMEPAIRQKVAEVLGVRIETGPTLVHPSFPWMSATPDGLFEFEGETTVLEMKNKTDRQSVYWGVAGTDEIPHDVAAQTHWQMEVTGAQRAVVAVLFGKADFRLYYLRRDLEIIEPVIDECSRFWHQHVLAGVEPPITGSKAAAEYLKKKFASHGDTLRQATRVEEPLVADLRAVKVQLAELEDREAALVNKLKAAIGSDAGIQSRFGRITWKAPAGGSVGWKDVSLALAKKHSIPQSAVDALVRDFTSEPARRFLATFPKED